MKKKGLHETNLNWDNRVPFEFDFKSFDSEERESKMDNVTFLFFTQLRKAMEDYTVKDYLNAIYIFKKLEISSIALLSDENLGGNLKWIREYYFYFGMSYLCLSITKRYNYFQWDRSRYASFATHYLSLAESLAQKYTLKNSDRDKYFLAIALKFKRRNALSINKLNEIRSDQQFYNKSLEILHKS